MIVELWPVLSLLALGVLGLITAVGAMGSYTPSAGGLAPLLIISGNEDGWVGRPDDFTQVLTSASTITLPGSGYTLVRVRCDNGTTPGAFQLLFDGIAKAMFPAGSNGTTGGQWWAVNWPVNGIVISSGIQTFLGGATNVTLIFSRAKTKAPPMAAYRAIRFTNATQHTALTALTAVTYDAGESVPRGVVAVSTVQANQFYWPTVGAAQSIVMADFVPGQASFHKAPALPKSTTLTPSVITPTTQGTTDFYVFYTPVGAQR